METKKSLMTHFEKYLRKLIFLLAISLSLVCKSDDLVYNYTGGSIQRNNGCWKEYISSSAFPVCDYTQTGEDQNYYYLHCHTGGDVAIPKKGGLVYAKMQGKWVTFNNKFNGKLMEVTLQQTVQQNHMGIQQPQQIIPFEGNVCITQSEYRNLVARGKDIFTYKEGSINSWNNSRDVLTLAFYTNKSGSFSLSIDASLINGTNQGSLLFSYGGKEYNVNVSSREYRRYYIGDFYASRPGYVLVNIKGYAVPFGTQFPRIKNFVVSGDIAASPLVFCDKADADTKYWNRRGPYATLYFTLPYEDCEWFYNEFTIPEGYDAPSSYYETCGFSCGYMGVQVDENMGKNFIFSVWSPYKTDNPSQIPSSQRVTLLRLGANVRAGEFGNEGSGSNCFLTYNWKVGRTYATLVHVRPDGKGNTDCTGYFRDETGVWHLMASFRRPQTNTWYKSPYAFVECFSPNGSVYLREAHYKAQWARTKNGKWIECTEATFYGNNIASGVHNVRKDMHAYSKGTEFIMRAGGFINETMDSNSKIKRQPKGFPPSVDFNALERL